MKTKTIQQLTEQWHRIAAYTRQHGKFGYYANKYASYWNRMAEQLKYCPGYYGRNEHTEATPVAREIYTADIATAQRNTARRILNGFDLCIDFAQYFYAMREQHPTITRAAIIRYFNEWQEGNADEWGDRWIEFPRAWQTQQPDGTIITQIPA